MIARMKLRDVRWFNFWIQATVQKKNLSKLLLKLFQLNNTFVPMDDTAYSMNTETYDNMKLQ